MSALSQLKSFGMDVGREVGKQAMAIGQEQMDLAKNQLVNMSAVQKNALKAALCNPVGGRKRRSKKRRSTKRKGTTKGGKKSRRARSTRRKSRKSRKSRK